MNWPEVYITAKGGTLLLMEGQGQAWLLSPSKTGDGLAGGCQAGRQKSLRAAFKDRMVQGRQG